MTCPAPILNGLLNAIANLPHAQAVKAAAAVETARRRTDAVVEIDSVGPERDCPHCESADQSSW